MSTLESFLWLHCPCHTISWRNREKRGQWEKAQKKITEKEMKQGCRERGKCQETGAKESGNGIRNGGRRRLEEGEIEGMLIQGEWKEGQRTATAMGKGRRKCRKTPK